MAANRCTLVLVKALGWRDQAEAPRLARCASSIGCSPHFGLRKFGDFSRRNRAMSRDLSFDRHASRGFEILRTSSVDDLATSLYFEG
jgi:hypothetical protein